MRLYRYIPSAFLVFFIKLLLLEKENLYFRAKLEGKKI